MKGFQWGSIASPHFVLLGSFLVLLGLFSSLFLSPVFVVFSSLFTGDGDNWQHLFDTVLVDYIQSSLTLALGVGAGAFALGTSLAWLVARYEFSGKRYFQWLVFLPMAMPAYIIAYTYTGMLDYAGPVQSAIRDIFGWGYRDYSFPDIRSMGGAILVMSLVLYPYVYMLARTAFLSQPKQMLEVSTSLGASGWRYFYRVAFPLARPAIVTGVALVMMETLADFGTVQYFGINTFTTGIFRTWYGLGDENTAAQLSSLLCTVVLVCLVLEQYSRRKQSYYHRQSAIKGATAVKLTGGKNALAVLLCSLPLLLGFLLPVMQLTVWSVHHFSLWSWGDFSALLLSSFGLASGAACFVVAFAIGVMYLSRLKPNWVLRLLTQCLNLGYAIPGVVVAVGILTPLGWLDFAANAMAKYSTGQPVGLIFSGSLFALFIAYAVRFNPIALHNVSHGLSRVTPSMDEAAATLGYRYPSILTKVHLPLIRTSVLTAALLVFVDVLKELPATLVLRPFNFNTLAVKAYELASDERLQEAALPALLIVLTGLVPVIILTRAMLKDTRHA